MTPETVLQEAADAIDLARRNAYTGGFLCFSEGKLKVVKNGSTHLWNLTFFKLTHRHILIGLTVQEWNGLKKRLWHFFEERT